MLGRDRRRGGTPPAKKRTNRKQSKNIAGTVPVPNPSPKPNQFSGRWLGTAGHKSATQAAERVALMALGLGYRASAGGQAAIRWGEGLSSPVRVGRSRTEREQNKNKGGTKGVPGQVFVFGRFLRLRGRGAVALA